MHLLDHFHELSIRPENAKELRGLILQLAVQGKLTAQWRKENPDVESAEVLLERIKAEKVELLEAGKIRKEKALPEIEEDEVPFEVPEGWVWSRLGEIGDWGAGSTPSRSNPDFYNGNINWFKSGELNNGLINYESKEKITELALSKSSLRLNTPGTVLIAMYGATIGKTGILNVKGTTNQAVCACKCYNAVNNAFLHLLLRSYKRLFMQQGEGGAQPNISRVKIRLQTFPLPPLQEQKAIVQIVDTLLKEVEQLEQLTQHRLTVKDQYMTSALRKLSNENTTQEWASFEKHFHSFVNEVSSVKQLRATILELAVKGKLTTHWREKNPDVEPASVLLERIREEKDRLLKEGKIRKEKALPEIGEVPFEVPEGWEWCRFGKIATIASNLVKPDNYLSFPHIAPNAIEKGTGRLLKYRSILEDGVKSSKHLFFPGQILYSKIRPKLNKLVVIDFHGLCSADMYPIDCYIDKGFLMKYMLSQFFLEQSTKTDTRVAMPKINQTELIKIKCPLPPLQEQKAIVEKVDLLMTLCDNLEKQIQKGQSIGKDLMKSVLREVFTQ